MSISSFDQDQSEEGIETCLGRGGGARQNGPTADRAVASADRFGDQTNPKLLALAAHDNVAVKISGACTLSREPFPYKDIWDPLGQVFDAFGFDRCMWGTDWTRAIRILTYKEGVDAFRVTDRLSGSERTALMGGTLQQLYNWH
jgi:predicted TIM-barrel fold metal-dependent hydrolase